MQYAGISRISFVIVLAMAVFWGQNQLIAAKEADELEEALMVKLLEKRAKKRTGDEDGGSPRLEKSDLKFLKSDDKAEISTGVVSDVKSTLKEPFLNLLASSELISWTELSDRVSKAKKAMELFEVKYRTELASGGKAVGEMSAPAVMPGAQKTVASMPGMAPSVKVATMPGAKPVAAKMAIKKVVDDDDDDDDDDDVPVKPKARPVGGMPGIAPRPVGMPGVVPVAGGMPGIAPVVGGMPGVAPMPMAAPAGMPGVAPVAGGMPMAK